jgi:hypothetical protein
MESVASADQEQDARKMRRRRATATAEVQALRRPSASSELMLEPKERIVASEVPKDRRRQIRRYLKLFGYKPGSSILQVHVAGYFGRGGRPKLKEVQAREKAAARYGGRTFTVVGTTHDPEILDRVIKPRKRPEEANPGYAGYLFKDKDPDEKDPDELLPLDFTPSGMTYPKEWKDMYATRGFLITMHVPSDYARSKNELLRRIRALGKQRSVKQDWDFLDDLEQFGYPNRRDSEQS